MRSKTKNQSHHVCTIFPALWASYRHSARHSDWFIALFGPVVIGRSNYFGICFSACHLKTAQSFSKVEDGEGDATKRCYQLYEQNNLAARAAL